MSYRLCMDIGGTFTDLVMADSSGNVTAARTFGSVRWNNATASDTF